MQRAQGTKTLKEKLISRPLWALPRRKGLLPLIQMFVMSKLLCQVTRAGRGPRETNGILVANRGFSERGYVTTQCKCLAVIWAVLLWHPKLEGTKLVERINHHSIKWVLDFADGTEKLAQWRLPSSEFDFEAVHRAGMIHQTAGALSKLPTGSSNDSPLDEDVKTILTDNSGELEAAYRYPCLTCEEDG